MIIRINNLKKKYGDVEAVKNVSLSIKKGEMFGLVGPDGAGKTTIIRTLCGLVSFNDGEVVILDSDIRKSKRSIQTKIAYLSQKFSLYRDLTIDENIEFFAKIHNVKEYKKRRDELLEFTRLTEVRDRPAENLSGGMKQKLSLACSLIHRPEILFLDEPTTGVDPVSRRDFWKILSDLLKSGITILMTTPYLDEAERCNRVALMNKGEIMVCDTPAKIKESLRKQVLEIVCENAKQAYDILKENFTEDVQLFGDRVNVVVENSEKKINLILLKLSENGIVVKESRIIPPTLENAFIHLIKKAG